MDKEIIIKGCENWVNNHKGENLLLAYSSVVELLTVLKEQEIVRCKNCKHVLPKGFCHKYSRKVADDWFCADGKRKESL